MKQTSRLLTALLVGLTGLYCASAEAADVRLKPGLWEVTVQSSLDGVAVQMPKLSPQQQAQMEKMGLKMPANGSSGVAVQTCLTKEQVERNEPPKPRDDARQKCEQQQLERSGNTVNWKVVCTGERPMTGTGSMTMQSPEAYSGTMNMVSQDPKHGTMTTKSNMQGRWLSADCGKK